MGTKFEEIKDVPGTAKFRWWTYEQKAWADHNDGNVSYGVHGSIWVYIMIQAALHTAFGTSAIH